MRNAATLVSTTVPIGCTWRWYIRRPLSMRAQSSTRSISSESRSVSCASISSTSWVCSGSFTRPSESVSMNIRIEVSGVRSSCETSETKSVFSRESWASR